MSHKNYTQYSKMSGEDAALIHKTEVQSEVEFGSDACCLNDCGAVENESVFNELPIEGQTVIPEVVVEPAVLVTPTIEPDIRKIGKIVGCSKLNVRKLPNRDEKILCEVAAGSEVMIDEKASTATYYKVCTEFGIEGYCMKQFVKILP